jgi:integrase
VTGQKADSRAGRGHNRHQAHPQRRWSAVARRARKQGSVYFDAARGCWRGELDIGRDPKTGRRVKRRVSAPDKSACADLLDELRVKFRTAGTVPRLDTTVRQLVEGALANPPPEVTSDITVAGHRNAGDRIMAALGHVQAVRLTADEVEKFLKAMAAEGYATDTIKKTRSLLVRALNRGQRNGLLTQNVAAIIPTPKGTRRQSRSMRADQVTALLATLTPWWRAWVTTGTMLGLRPGELLGLCWEDVDFTAGVIRVRYSLKAGKDDHGRTILVRAELKTEKSRRTIEMPAAVRSALIALRKHQAAQRLKLGRWYADSGLAFCNTEGRPCWHQNVNKEFKELCADAGLGDWTGRELRHTFCSILSDAGVDIEKISDAMGHSNSTVTRAVYRHSLADKVSDAARVMDAMWGS